jgi:hypothetical protein
MSQKGGDYLFVVRGHQRTLKEEISTAWVLEEKSPAGYREPLQGVRDVLSVEDRP